MEIADARNLHSAWDSGIIHASGRSAADLVNDVRLRTPEASTITHGSYADWAMEGFATARDVVYKQVEDGRITDAERGAAIEIISTEIARAAARLAAVIERTLGSPQPRR